MGDVVLTDPLGRTIILHDRTWHGHILKAHPEMGATRRLVDHRQAHAYSEETEDGLLTVRRQDNDQVVGITVVNWWRRFGTGPLPDSIQELERAIEPWAQRLAT
jgi:hypothetical protein